jgi:Mn2+/Fe2+ NRAMP family transporter
MAMVTAMVMAMAMAMVTATVMDTEPKRKNEDLQENAKLNNNY